MVYISIIITLFTMVLMTYDVLQILQQNHYHMTFLKKYFIRTIKSIDCVVILISLLRFINYHGLLVIIDYILLLIEFCFCVFWFMQKKIIKLSFTGRVKRMLVCILLLCTLEIVLLDYKLLIVSASLNVFFSLLILEPIQREIDKYYIKKAKEKINEIKPLIIGITGSAGKTSVKHYLYHMLKDEKVTFMTPKSYNTLMGLCKAINEGLKNGTEIAIIEYGASKKGDIDQLLRLVKPNIAVVTNVLPQHLETFKSIENVMKEKFKLLKAAEVAILNTDIIDTILPSSVKKITVGRKKDTFYNIKESKIDSNGCEFNINGMQFKSELVGKCNYENIVLATAVSLFLGVDKKSLFFSVSNLTAVKNRLEIKKMLFNNVEKIIIDDSFNSNVKGFNNAIDVLLGFENKKVIITPGIMEGGKKEKEINALISTKIIKSKIDTYIVKSKCSSYIINEFKKSNNIYYELYDNFISAFNDALIKYDVILIENDISDIYKK